MERGVDCRSHGSGATRNSLLAVFERLGTNPGSRGFTDRSDRAGLESYLGGACCWRTAFASDARWRQSDSFRIRRSLSVAVARSGSLRRIGVVEHWSDGVPYLTQYPPRTPTLQSSVSSLPEYCRRGGFVPFLPAVAS